MSRTLQEVRTWRLASGALLCWGYLDQPWRPLFLSNMALWIWLPAVHAHTSPVLHSSEQDVESSTYVRRSLDTRGV